MKKTLILVCVSFFILATLSLAQQTEFQEETIATRQLAISIAKQHVQRFLNKIDLSSFTWFRHSFKCKSSNEKYNALDCFLEAKERMSTNSALSDMQIDGREYYFLMSQPLPVIDLYTIYNAEDETRIYISSSQADQEYEGEGILLLRGLNVAVYNYPSEGDRFIFNSDEIDVPLLLDPSTEEQELRQCFGELFEEERSGCFVEYPGRVFKFFRW